jgi:MFS family permease
MIPTAIVHSSNVDLHLKYNLYGWRNFRCGGILSRPLFAYIILCICTFIQNFSVNGANNAVISTIERVFYLDSVQSGLFLALYDLATVFSAPLVGYLGSSYSSPVFFSLNMIIVAFGNMLIVSSNFINRSNKLNFNSDLTQSLLSDNVLFQCYHNPLSPDNVTNAACLQQENFSTVRNAKIILYLGNFVNGIGSVALFTIGVAYIERMFPREKAAYCQGIYFAVGTVGGALGIVATGRFLLLYTELIPKRFLPSWLTPSNPLWIGCWWLPYIIYGSLCFLIGIFVSGLPNYEIPGERHLINQGNTNIPTISAQQQNSDIAIIREDSPTVNTTITSCSPTPTTNHTVSESCVEDSTTNGIINHAFSTDTLYNELPVPSSNPPVQPQTRNENWRRICVIIGELLRNTRFVFIVIANLFEGILLKGKFSFENFF